MNSPKLNQCFETKCNQTYIENSLASILCSIDPKYALEFENYRNSILWTIESWSQI